MKHSRTVDKIGSAKSALLDALRSASEEKMPDALIKQIDALIGKAETIQRKIQSRS